MSDYQCFAWDGKTLASLYLHNNMHAYHFARLDARANPHAFPRSMWGEVQAIAMAGNGHNQGYLREITRDEPMEQVVRFYRNAAKQGLVAKSLRAMLLAVMDAQIVSIDIREGSCQIHHGPVDRYWAIGDGRSAATALMVKGVPAEVAVGAIHLDPNLRVLGLKSCGVSYRAEKKEWAFVGDDDVSGSLCEHGYGLHLRVRGEGRFIGTGVEPPVEDLI